MSLQEQASKVRCPTCGAQPGSRCVKLSASARSWVVDSRGQMAGQWAKNYHDERVDLGRESSRYDAEGKRQ